MALMRSSTICLAPSPMASIAITEATPITMPSRVSTVRKRLARSALTPVFAASRAPPTSEAPPSVAGCWISGAAGAVDNCGPESLTIPPSLISMILFACAAMSCA